jgi:hypothetical protein
VICHRLSCRTILRCAPNHVFVRGPTIRAAWDVGRAWWRLGVYGIHVVDVIEAVNGFGLRTSRGRSRCPIGPKSCSGHGRLPIHLVY